MGIRNNRGAATLDINENLFDSYEEAHKFATRYANYLSSDSSLSSYLVDILEIDTDNNKINVHGVSNE